MLNAEEVLGRLLDGYLASDPFYGSTLASRDIAIIFSQHTGAALAAAAVALANIEHPAYTRKIGEKIGRPAVKVSVSFQLGNRSVAHGFPSQKTSKNNGRTIEQTDPPKTGNAQHLWGEHVVIHEFTDRRKSDNGKLLLAPLDITSPSLHWTGPSSTVLACGVNVVGRNGDVLRSLREAIKEYPLPFLSWCVLKGSTLA
nr:MAG: wsv198-like protein [Marsupenaeus japonicus pemonivirus]